MGTYHVVYPSGRTFDIEGDFFTVSQHDLPFITPLAKAFDGKSSIGIDYRALITDEDGVVVYDGRKRPYPFGPEDER